MLADKTDQCKIQIEFLLISLSSVNIMSVAQTARECILAILFTFNTRMCVCSLSTLGISWLFENIRFFNIILRVLCLPSSFLSFPCDFPASKPRPSPSWNTFVRLHNSRLFVSLAASFLLTFVYLCVHRLSTKGYG